MPAASFIPHFNDREQLNGLVLATPFALFLAALMLPGPTPWVATLRRFGFAPVIVPMFLRIPLAYKTGEGIADYTVATLCCTWALKALDFLVWNPCTEQSFRYLGPDQVARRNTISKRSATVYEDQGASGLSVPDGSDATSKESVAIVDASTRFLPRLAWAASLMLTLRGINWTHSPPPSIIPPSPRSRWVRVKNLLLAYVFVDLVGSYMQSQPFFKDPQHPPASTSAQQGLNYIAGGIAGYTSLAFQAYLVELILSLPPISLPPERNPPLFHAPFPWIRLDFGDFPHSIAGFWTHTWHQIMRRPFTFALDSPPGQASFAGPKLLHLIVAFGTSAFVHSYAVRAVSGPGTWHATAIFFTLQIVGIVAERAVRAAIGGTILNTLGKAIGRLWVAAWFVGTGSFFVHDLLWANFWKYEAVPISVVRGLWKGTWVVA